MKARTIITIAAAWAVSAAAAMIFNHAIHTRTGDRLYDPSTGVVWFH